MYTNQTYQYVYSKFTRDKGFVDIESSLKISRKHSIKILNSFTPQGASPRGSFRISTFEDNLGAGYYWMEDVNTSHLFTLLLGKKRIENGPFIPPYPIDHLGVISKRNLVYSEQDKFTIEFDDILNGFSRNHISSLLYSTLTGDNILIVDPNSERRIKLIFLLLSILPKSVLNYNRITSGCAELDGNENIVGLDILPRKYRSAKKLFLPIDTIFVDLQHQSIEGDGVKACTITDKLSDFLHDTLHDGYDEIKGLLTKIQKDETSQFDDVLDIKFVERIQNKLGMKTKIKQEWMMF